MKSKESMSIDDPSGQCTTAKQKMYKPAVVRIARGGGTKYGGDPRGLMRRDDDAVFWKPKFVPIKDWRGYLNVQKMHGASKEELERLEALHKCEDTQTPVPAPKKEYNTRPVLVKFRVTEEGGVRVTVVENKLATMLRDYSSRGKIPPRKVWIEAWIQAGRDFKDVLAGIVRMESRKNERFELLEKLNKEPAKTVKPKKILKPVVKIS